MKTAHDPRHQKRRDIVKTLFAETFTHQPNISDEVRLILSKKEEIDKKITESAPQWPISNLNKIDLAILRLSVYELEEGKVPPKVVIDEAVELAKEFGGDNSPSFINGVLGTIYGEEDKEEKKENKNEGKN